MATYATAPGPNPYGIPVTCMLADQIRDICRESNAAHLLGG